ncbi:glyoxalase-like protein [Bradyrhizobium stylosanthis]|uniref:Glyoxalase-like protein n=1 Tax=Bradyrhizobium stylosanthis TaxID=1803665 RepID=A0A560D1M7_9BRAD|nr:glyoxalase-like protein [Bradyrhizobium stylosanthis]
MLRLDHITVAANDLAEGVAYVEDALGIAPPAGGAHPLMGTHNHLLRLSETSFLEVIAPDPSAPAPTRPRWSRSTTRAHMRRWRPRRGS